MTENGAESGPDAIGKKFGRTAAPAGWSSDPYAVWVSAVALDYKYLVHTNVCLKTCLS